jgi:hypothetical protein
VEAVAAALPPVLRLRERGRLEQEHVPSLGVEEGDDG